MSQEESWYMDESVMLIQGGLTATWTQSLIARTFHNFKKNWKIQASIGEHLVCKYFREILNQAELRPNEFHMEVTT